MLVIQRRRNERTVARLHGAELAINVCSIYPHYVRLGFTGPHEVYREEVLRGFRVEPIAHLAGELITIGDYSIQRCQCCGEILAERESSHDPLSNNYWPGQWYQFVGDSIGIPIVSDQSATTQYASDLALPRHACIRS